MLVDSKMPNAATGRRYIPASEFCLSVRDGTHDSPRPSDRGRKLVTSRNLTTGRLDLSGAYLISESDFEQINRRSKVEQWDVLISMIGTVGEVCLVKNEPDFAIKNIGLFKTRGQADGRWLYYYLQSRTAQESLLKELGGTTQKYITLGALRRFPILVTDDPQESERITHILATLDDKIELDRRMNATLEAMARALFRSWFVDFDPVRAKIEGRDTGLPKEIADLFPDRLVDSELGEIPKGWTVGTLGEIASSPRSGVDPTSVAGDTPYIGLEHMPRRSVALMYWGSAANVSSNKTVFERGDILFGKLRPYFHKVGIAPVTGVCSTDIVVLKARRPTWSAFVLACVSSSGFVGYASQTSTGTKMPRTSWHTMSKYELCTPNDSIVSAFQQVVSGILKRVVANVYESRNLGRLRDSLLPKLVSGELRVTGLEPARVQGDRSARDRPAPVGAHES